jgi:CxxC motif-containing protein (DUF1111 family)
VIRLAALAASACIVFAGSVLAGSPDHGLDFALGKALFHRMWVQAPSSTKANDGLGPLFNEKSCASCHSGTALSASIVVAPDGSITDRGLAVRLGDAEGHADPLYGRQIQPRSVTGIVSEGRVAYRLEGTPPRVTPVFTPERGPLAATTHMSVRQAPALRGVSALGAVDEAAVERIAAEQHARGDGPAGRPRYVTRDGKRLLGRYGWKAAAPTIAAQTADAFGLDIGMSSPLFPHPYGDCTQAEPDCLAAPNGRDASFDGEEISNQMIGLLVAYIDGLKAPAPVPDARGEALFAATGCAACHVPDMPATGGGTVRVFSDLLLHDMGPGLDDGVAEPGVLSSEWRTAPLLTLSVRRAPDRRYLHDGRAATIEDAISAHGGEAEAARSRFMALSPDDRAALIAYLETL